MNTADAFVYISRMTTDEHGGRIRVYKPDVATAYMSKIIWSAP